jgi:hypothetical protein
MPRIWEELRRARSMFPGIIEDPSRPADERIQFFGASAFIQPAFLAELMARPAPHVAARIYECILAGRRPC